MEEFSGERSTAVDNEVEQVRKPDSCDMPRRAKTGILIESSVAKSLRTFIVDDFWDAQGKTFDTANPGYQYQVNISLPGFTCGRLRAERKARRTRR
jgi:hypothetical protein